ncbi:MAG TPA: Uma2 family endonuclease [Streptomyces sp.]|nr:Uma2 family endonuclease [Streptomyces sp.]
MRKMTLLDEADVVRDRLPGRRVENIVAGPSTGGWLPSGPYDYAVPDLSVVDPGIDEHMVENNCYDPAWFRLVVEVTSNNYNQDLQTKVAAYAESKIPVYVIVDRKHGRIHVLTEPEVNEYDSHRAYDPGQQVVLPESIGAEVTLDAAELLKTEGHTL